MARNGMKICTEMEEREREKLNSASPSSPPFPLPFPSVFLFLSLHLRHSANRGFLFHPKREREKEREMEKEGRKEKADPCLRAECDWNQNAAVRLREDGRKIGKTADPQINYVRNVAAASTNCFAFRSSLFRARLTGCIHNWAIYIKKKRT